MPFNHYGTCSTVIRTSHRTLHDQCRATNKTDIIFCHPRMNELTEGMHQHLKGEKVAGSSGWFADFNQSNNHINTTNHII